MLENVLFIKYFLKIKATVSSEEKRSWRPV